MQRKLLALTFCALLSTGTASAAPAKIPQNIESYIRVEMEQEHIPALAVAIVDHGRVVTEAAYGTANLEWGEKAGAHTPFQLASATKLITATALMVLVQQHKISLDDTLGAYLADVPQPLKSITVRQLAAHLSGIPMTPLNTPTATFQDAVKAAESLNLQWAPGRKTGYVSDDYILLRAVMEKAGGEPYPQLVHDLVLGPLGMSDTAFDDTIDDGVIQRASPIPRRVENYSWDGTKQLLFHGVYKWASAAGAFCSIDDLAKWALSLDNHRVLSEASIAVMTAPVALADGRPGPFGIGVVVSKKNGELTFGHSGGPALADILHYPGRDLTVIVLQNQIKVMPHLAQDIAALYIGSHT
jgi:CubicO group peptidase (beta-lactamase class C family)